MARIEYDETSQYCQTTDVARFFEQYDDFDANTNPTGTAVDEAILEWSEYIDDRTRHAWRPNTVVEEHRDLHGPYYYWSGIAVNLSKRDVRTLDNVQGDKLEIWEGNSWNDWLTDSSKTEGRNNAYWLEGSTGKLWIHDRFLFRRHPHMRVTYRYGNPNGATKAIQMACAKLVASDLVLSDQYSMNIPGTDGGADPENAAEQWRQSAEATLDRKAEMSYAEPY